MKARGMILAVCLFFSLSILLTSSEAIDFSQLTFRGYSLGMSIDEASKVAGDKLQLSHEETYYYREAPWGGASLYFTVEDEKLFRIERTTVEGSIKPADSRPMDSFLNIAGELIDTAIAKYGKPDKVVTGKMRGSNLEAAATWGGDFATQDQCVQSNDPSYEIDIYYQNKEEDNYVYMGINLVDCAIYHDVLRTRKIILREKRKAEEKLLKEERNQELLEKHGDKF